jgi:hypothetical protein
MRLNGLPFSFGTLNPYSITIFVKSNMFQQQVCHCMCQVMDKYHASLIDGVLRYNTAIDDQIRS